MGKSFIFKEAKKDILDGKIDLINDPVLVHLMSPEYVPDPTHRYFSQINENHEMAPPVELVSKTLKRGTFDAADANFVAVTPGLHINSILLSVVTKEEWLPRLLAYLSPEVCHGMPLISWGGDIRLVWSNGEDRIFSL